MWKFDWVDPTIAIGTALGAGVAVQVSFVQPRLRKRAKERAEADENHKFLTGVPATLITPEVLPAAVRLSNIEQVAKATLEMVIAIDKKITPNGGNTNNIGDILRRNAEANGTWLDEGEPHDHE